MTTSTTILLALLATFVVTVCTSPAHSIRSESSLDNTEENELDNKLFNYVPPSVRRDGVQADGVRNNIIRPVSYLEMEREEANKDVISSIYDKTAPPTSSDAKLSPSFMDKVKSIAFNSREVRLVGPQLKPVEMKDDMPTKIVVAWDNLQKDAAEVWGDVNLKLDKSWKDLKTMIDGAIAKANKQESSERSYSPGKSSSLVVVNEGDGYSMADDSSSSSQQLEAAANKIKGFLSEMGLNEENQKKANEALTKAGSSVSQTMTKDLPDALQKAGVAISDTVTKDIPNAFKNIFG